MNLSGISSICCFLSIGVMIAYSEINGCSDSMVCTYFETNGSILIDRNASQMTHVIDVRNEPSIIKLTMHPVNESEILSTNIKVHIKEPERETEWKLLPGEPIRNFTYVSSTASFNITFTSDEDWIDLILTYDELKFEIRSQKILKDSGTLRPGKFSMDFSKPNTMTVYNIVPNPKIWNVSSVMVMVKTLEVDDLTGDYMLIGAGKELFGGPPAAFLTGKIKTHEKYYIEADDIYIAVLHTSEKQPDFDVEWMRTGSRIKEPEKEPDMIIPDSVSQASPICFYNESWISEFSHAEDSSHIESFRKNFAEVANNYIKKKQIKFVEEISPSAVQIVRISTIIPSSKNVPHGAIYALVTIVQSYDTKLAVFRWQEIEEIVQAYNAEDEARGYEFGFKVGNCPTRAKNSKWWYVAAALLILFSTAFFVGIWICAYNHMWRKNIRKGQDVWGKNLKKPQKQGSIRKHKEVNHVAYINPAITITDEDGNSVHASSNHYTNVQTDEDSEAEIYDINWTMKAKSSKSEPPERKEEASGQIHVFKSPTAGERISPSSLMWFQDKFGVNQTPVRIEVHNPPEQPNEAISQDLKNSREEETNL